MTTPNAHTTIADAIAEMQEATDDADLLAGYVLTSLLEQGWTLTHDSET